MPFMILLAAGISVVLITQYALVVMEEAAELGIASRSLIHSRLNRYYSRSDIMKTEKLLWYKMWRAQHPVKIWCGPFFVVDKSTASTFMEEVIDKLVTAVLLVKPT